MPAPIYGGLVLMVAQRCAKATRAVRIGKPPLIDHVFHNAFRLDPVGWKFGREFLNINFKLSYMNTTTESAVITAPAGGAVAQAQTGRNVTAFDFSFVPDIDAKKLEAAPKVGLNLSMVYHSFEQGVEERGLFLGCMDYPCVDEKTGEVNMLLGAVWVDKNRQGKICCAVKFVSAIQAMPSGTAFSATFTKTKRTKSGRNMQLFDVYKIDA